MRSSTSSSSFAFPFSSLVIASWTRNKYFLTSSSFQEGKKETVDFLFIYFKLPHSSFQSFLRRKITMDRMTRTLAKMAMKQRPSMYVVIHIKSKVIASRQPGKRAFLLLPSPLLSRSSGLKEDSTEEGIEEDQHPPRYLSFFPRFSPFFHLMRRWRRKQWRS